MTSTVREVLYQTLVVSKTCPKHKSADNRDGEHHTMGAA